jgi:hypothetical protein
MDMAQLTKHYQQNDAKSSPALFKALVGLLALVFVGASIEYAWNSYRVTTGPSAYFVQMFGTGRSGWHSQTDSVVDGPFATLQQCTSAGLRDRPRSSSIGYACRQMLISDARRLWNPQSTLNWRGKDAPP